MSVCTVVASTLFLLFWYARACRSGAPTMAQASIINASQPNTDLLAQFIGLHYAQESTNNGMLHIWAKSHKKNGNMYRLFYGVPTLAEAKIKADRLAEAKRDFYITANTMQSGLRGQEYIFSYKNIVIDLDNHTNANKQTLWYQAGALKQIYTDIMYEPGYYAPNTIVSTGRGYQLWFNLEQIGYKCADAYKVLNEEIIKQTRAILEDYKDILQGLSIDTGASTNEAGLFRLPTTYNTKSRTSGTLEILHDEPINTLAEVKKIRQKNKEERQGAKVIQFYGNSESAIYNMASHRHNALLSLAQIRTEQGQTIERDNFLFCDFCIWANVYQDNAEVLTKVKELNKVFNKPLSDKELTNNLKTACKKRYKAKNKTIIDRLAITEEEQAQIRFYAGNNREAERTKTRKAKASKYNAIIDAYNKGKGTQSELAKLFNVSRKTINNILAKAGARKKDIKGAYRRIEDNSAQIIRLEQIRAYKSHTESHKTTYTKHNPGNTKANVKMCKNCTIYGGNKAHLFKPGRIAEILASKHLAFYELLAQIRTTTRKKTNNAPMLQGESMPIIPG